MTRKTSLPIYDKSQDSRSQSPNKDKLAQVAPIRLAHVAGEGFEELSIRKLIDLHRLQKIQDSFAKATGLALIAIDCKGVPITRESSFTNFCRLMRKDPIRRKRCLGCDAHGGLQGAINGEPYIYQCHAGLVDFAVPIMLGDQYLGAVLCGQVKMAKDQDRFNYVAPFDDSWRHNKELVKMHLRVPSITAERLEAAADTLYELTAYLVEQGYSYGLTMVANKFTQGEQGEENPSRDQWLIQNLAQTSRTHKHIDVQDYSDLAVAIDSENLPEAVAVLERFISRVFSHPRKQIAKLRINNMEDAIISLAQEVSLETSWEVRKQVFYNRSKRQIKFDRYQVQKYLEFLIFHLYDSIQCRKPAKPRRINDLLNQLEKDPSLVLTAQAAANYLNVSSSYLSKAFRAATGTNYLNYVTNKRVHKAKQMLKFTNLAISAIANELGFQPLNYFTRVFKKTTGYTPSEYRNLEIDDLTQDDLTQVEGNVL